MIYDLAILGCGPVGALAANLAGQAGLSTLVVDRETIAHPLPRAVHLDHEMMRLFQSVGLSAAMAPLMRETEGHLHIGADGGVIRYMGTAGRPKPYGWASDYFFFQPELEQVLRDGLNRFDRVTTRFGLELAAMEQDKGGVTLSLSGLEGASQERARWVVACDGARSTVRRMLGIALEDMNFEEPWLVVDAEVDAPIAFPRLSKVPEGADLQQLSVMMCDPSRPATIVPGRGNLRRWEFMLLPGEDDADMMRSDRVAALIAPYLEGVPHRIIRATTYRFHGLIAERWRSERVFLAGDAAHQTPPFFGQGMCHGMRDVANLVWKLGLVIGGRADETLLDTYQSERDPHVRSVVTAAIEAGRYICELDPARAAARDAEMRARARSAPHATATDLIPSYRKGAVLAGSPGSGERFIQPRSRDGGVMIDDAVGGGWRLFIRNAALATQACAARDAASGIDVRVVDVDDLDDADAIADWLDARGVTAVLVRPDFYVFGSTSENPSVLLEKATAVLALRSVETVF